jgi:ABC-type glycerol-3-phosphate transport system substrate-binding protein
MKEKLSPFQIIVFASLIVAIIAGVLIFSLRRQSSQGAIETVTAWGTANEETINFVLNELNEQQKGYIDVVYTQYSPNVFEQTLVDSLAAGEGPDLVFLPDDLLIKHKNKVFNISYEFYPQKNFKEEFIQAADILLNEEGAVGLPLTIDPLVLYYNRSMLNSASIAKTPEFWDQVIEITPVLTKTDTSLNVQKSSIALGEFSNIQHAKDILVTLLMQAGNDIVVPNTGTGSNEYNVTLEESFGNVLRPAEAVISFYTQFSNPSTNYYSWNRSLPNSKDMFLAGDLAFYLGFASEYADIRVKNPNLNFDVAKIPQSRSNTDTKLTTGKMMFVSLIKNSPRLQAAFDAASKLTSHESISLLSDVTNLPPVRRDLLTEQNENAALQTFYESALISRVFLDPAESNTNSIFSDMIESYTSGRSSISATIQRAQRQLEDLLN